MKRHFNTLERSQKPNINKTSGKNGKNPAYAAAFIALFALQAISVTACSNGGNTEASDYAESTSAEAESAVGSERQVSEGQAHEGQAREGQESVNGFMGRVTSINGTDVTVEKLPDEMMQRHQPPAPGRSNDRENADAGNPDDANSDDGNTQNGRTEDSNISDGSVAGNPRQSGDHPDKPDDRDGNTSRPESPAPAESVTLNLSTAAVYKENSPESEKNTDVDADNNADDNTAPEKNDTFDTHRNRSEAAFSEITVGDTLFVEYSDSDPGTVGTVTILGLPAGKGIDPPFGGTSAGAD